MELRRNCLIECNFAVHKCSRMESWGDHIWELLAWTKYDHSFSCCVFCPLWIRTAWNPNFSSLRAALSAISSCPEWFLIHQKRQLNQTYWKSMLMLEIMLKRSFDALWCIRIKRRWNSFLSEPKLYIQLINLISIKMFTQILHCSENQLFLGDWTEISCSRKNFLLQAHTACCSEKQTRLWLGLIATVPKLWD